MSMAMFNGGQKPPVDFRLQIPGTEQGLVCTRFDVSCRFLHHVARLPASSWKHSSNLPSSPTDVICFLSPSSMAMWPAAFDRVRLRSMLDYLYTSHSDCLSRGGVNKQIIVWEFSRQGEERRRCRCLPKHLSITMSLFSHLPTASAHERSPIR